MVKLQMSAGHVGARVLRELGIDQVSGVAGESFLPLLEGLRREGIPFINTAHEAGAVFMALGRARTSELPGVAAVTRGPGASNSLIGIYEAMKSGTPLILIVGQVDTVNRYRDGIQEMEIVDVFKPTVKAAIEVTRSDRFGPALLASFRLSLQGKPGPVVLSVPTDHLYGEASPTEVPGIFRDVKDAGPSISDDALGRVLAAVEPASRVLAILGHSFRDYRHAKLVSTVAEAGGFGVLGAHSCLDVMEHDDPQWIGCSTVRASDHMARAIAEAEVILSFDSDFGDQTSRGFTETGARLFAFSTGGTAIWDEYLGADHIMADPVSVLRGLSARYTPSGVETARRDWVAGIQAAMKKERTIVYDTDRAVTDAGVPMSMVAESLDRTLPLRSLVVSDVGTFNDWFTRYLPFSQRRRYVGPTSNPMGFALPTALGAHGPAQVDRTVVLSGDGGFLMSGMELATLSRLGLPVTVIVFDNGVWGSIARDQDRVYGVRYGTEFGSAPDFALLAQAFGIEGRTIDHPSDLETELAAAFDNPGPSLLVVKTDPQRLSPADVATRGAR